MYKKITHKIFEEQFDQEPAAEPKPKWQEWDGLENEEDVIKMNVPLLLRILEWAREEAYRDCDLHEVAERLVELSEYGQVLDMEYYNDIVGYTEYTFEKK